MEAAMMRVELTSLEREGLVLDERGWAQALGVELEPALCCDPLEVHCELSKFEGLVVARGWVKGKMILSCDRCLKEFGSPYKSFFEIHYKPVPEGGPPEEASGEEVETVYYEGDRLDLADQVRQTILLSVPMRALCREDCKGFCSGCGSDLNRETCRCGEPPSDPRWDALKKLKL
jgi:uncharacterized protein